MLNADLEEKLKNIQVTRSVFRAVFEDANGIQVLAWIGNECGAWSQDPEKVKPELIALWNRLLGKIGSVHEANLLTIAKAMIVTSNDEDIAAIRRAENQRKEE